MCAFDCIFIVSRTIYTKNGRPPLAHPKNSKCFNSVVLAYTPNIGKYEKSTPRVRVFHTLADWLAGYLAVWLPGWLAAWLAGCLAGWPTSWLAGWLAG